MFDNGPFSFFIADENGSTVHIFSDGGADCVGNDGRNYLVVNDETVLLVSSGGFVDGEFTIHKSLDDLLAVIESVA